MTIRDLKPGDLMELREVWAKHYSDQFKFDDFLLPHYIAAFVVEDQGKIITAGGIRTIVESVLITNKDVPVKSRVKALKQVLLSSCYFAERAGYNQIHAFVQEPDWEKQLESIGFRRCRGDAIYYNL